MPDVWNADFFDYSALPERARSWKLRTRVLEFGGLPCWMGIVNVTPDSFSDGGRFYAADAAVDHALRLVEEGAHVLDIGGESTRPYSTPVDADDEIARVMPVIERIASRTSVPISIDTSKAVVALAAIDAGAEIVNDVTGLTGDPAMLPLVAERGVGVCAMHMQGTPQTMQDNPHYENVVDDIHRYLTERRDALLVAGIDPLRICLDPGIGFGKTHEHNFSLAANCWRYHELGCPLLVGHSRKGFLAKLLVANDADRTAATAGVSASLARQGVQIIRVHDVATNREAVVALAATGGLGRT